MDQTALMKVLDLVYEKATKGIPGTEGIPGMGSVEDFAAGYMQGDKSLEEKVDTLINSQVAKASASGFVSGFGGWLTLPIALPTNLVSIAYIQLQMSAAIAHMAGYDIRDDRVKAFCYVSLCGESASKLLRGAGIVVGKKLTEQMIKRISFETIKKINKAVGFRLITKFGQTGAINLGKAIPVAGGLLGGTFDGIVTFTVGKAAKRIFITGEKVQADVTENPEPDSGSWLGEVASLERDTDEFLQKELTDAEDFLFGRVEDDGKKRR